MEDNYKTYMNTLVSILVSTFNPKLKKILKNQPLGWFNLNVLNLSIIIILLLFLIIIIKLRRKINKINNDIENISLPRNSSVIPIDEKMEIDTEIQPKKIETKPKVSGMNQYREKKHIISEDSKSESDSSFSAKLEHRNNYYLERIKSDHDFKTNNHFKSIQKSSPFNACIWR